MMWPDLEIRGEVAQFACPSEGCVMSLRGMLPDEDTILGGYVHLVLGLDVKGLVEGIDVLQCLIDT